MLYGWLLKLWQFRDQNFRDGYKNYRNRRIKIL